MRRKYFLFFLLSNLIFVSNLHSAITFNWKVGGYLGRTLYTTRSETAEVKAEAGVRLFKSTKDTKETSFYVDHTQTVRITYDKGGSYSAYEVNWLNWPGYISPINGEYQTLTPGWYKIKAYVYRDWWKCWFDRKL